MLQSTTHNAEVELTQSSRATFVRALIGSLILLLTGIVLYGSLLQFSFFAEDPIDIGQVDGHSYAELMLLPNSNLYYRPLMLMTMKLLQGQRAGYAPLPYHALDLAAHLLSTLLLFGVASDWLRNRKVAFGAALLFLIYPVTFESVARAMSPHPLLMAITLGALWAYSAGRQKNRPWLVLLALGLCSLGMLVQENGVLTPFMLIALELFLAWQRRVERFHFVVLVFLIPMALFVALWLMIPREANTVMQWGMGLQEGLYLSQGLSFPFAALISQTGGWGLTPQQQAVLALILALCTLTALCPRASRPQLVLAIMMWGIGCSLTWVARNMEYLDVSPRLMYFSSFAAALAWATLIPPAWPERRRVQGGVGALIVLGVGVHSVVTVSHEIALYQHGSALMDQTMAAGQTGEKLLFVNLPDRFSYRQPLYPLGYWGMLIAPVSMDVGDYVWLNSGTRIQTRSLSDFAFAADMMAASPYRVDTRGSDAHASGTLYESALWANKTYLTLYHPDGSFTLSQVGSISATPSSESPIGRVGDVAEVLSGTVELRDDSIIATVQWRPQRAAGPSDTLFVHVLDASGKLVAQEDGNSLGGLIFPSAWRAGNEVLDRRTILLKAPLPPGTYRVTTGIYDRVASTRYQAFDASGVPITDGELEVARFVAR
jgi:hypothetical protein